MEKFNESIHCTSRTHCIICTTDEQWRNSILQSFDWDGFCPLSEERIKIIKEIRYNRDVLNRMNDRNCRNCEKKRQQNHINNLEASLSDIGILGEPDGD